MSAASEIHAAELQRQFMEATREVPLHELVDRVLAIVADVADAEGEVSADQDAQLDALNLSIERKTEAYAAAYERLHAERDSLRELAKRYTAKAEAREAGAERLRERLHAELQRLGRDVVKTPTSSARIQNSPDKLELLIEDEPKAMLLADVPHEFVVRPPEKINRKALTEALKSGRTFTFARLVKSTHLRFR